MVLFDDRCNVLGFVFGAQLAVDVLFVDRFARRVFDNDKFAFCVLVNFVVLELVVHRLAVLRLQMDTLAFDHGLALFIRSVARKRLVVHNRGFSIQLLVGIVAAVTLARARSVVGSARGRKRRTQP